MRLALHQIQWQSVRRAEGGGFYTWETERKEVAAGSWEVTTAVPARDAPPAAPARRVLRSARERPRCGRPLDADGHRVLRPRRGLTAWERYDHNRIDLIPERQRYRPGETARILGRISLGNSDGADHDGARGGPDQEDFTLRSTQETLEVPIEEADVPNVYDSVVLIKGRTGSYTDTDASDPGKPAFRLGYVELKVEDATKRLKVQVETDLEEYRPADKARVSVCGRRPQGSRRAGGAHALGRGLRGPVPDGYSPPDLVDAVYVPKALQVLDEDSRQNIVSRRVIVPKGAEEGGGGGAEDGADAEVRRDFRVLAFWLGSVVTDAQGRASAEVPLPSPHDVSRPGRRGRPRFAVRPRAGGDPDQQARLSFARRSPLPGRGRRGVLRGRRARPARAGRLGDGDDGKPRCLGPRASPATRGRSSRSAAGGSAEVRLLGSAPESRGREGSG